MVYVWIAIVIVILFLVWRLVKAWNGPKMAKYKLEKRKAWLDFRAERRRNGLFGRRRRSNSSEPKLEGSPTDHQDE